MGAGKRRIGGGKKRCQCQNQSSRATEFDTERAIRLLSRRLDSLSEIVAQYMSEAPLERKKRNKSALALSNSIRARTIGGTLSNERFPECCAIGSFDGGVVRFFCSGVLIHPELVLTAAHCLDDDDISFDQLVVAMNIGNLEPSSLSNAEIVATHEPYVHDDYEPNGHNDIAVIPLRVPAKTKPVKLAKGTEMKTLAEVITVGYGADDPLGQTGFGIKREVRIPIRAIRNNRNEDLDADESTFRFDSELEFVAGGGGVDSCLGDSGGPAYGEIDGKTKLVGLVARAVHNGICGDGGVYSRLDTQLDFIKSVAADFDIKM